MSSYTANMQKMGKKRFMLFVCHCRPEDAMPDFESVLKLNKDNACAHVNLGLIMMNHYDNYHR